MLNSFKVDLGLRVLGVYCIPCTCVYCYIGQTGHSVLERREEHQQYLRLRQLEKSALSEHAVSFNHEILFSSADVLFRSDGYWEYTICGT